MGGTSKEEKDAKKAALKEEAKKLGISYDELKKRNKKKRREAEALESAEHATESKRMRSWSKGDDDDDMKGTSSGKGSAKKDSKDSDERETKRRRTRSMDAAEERKVLQENAAETNPEEWRKEHQIIIQGHGTNANNDIPDPFFLFDQAPFCDSIQRAFKQAGYEKPTAIQSQAWPIGIQRIDMICVAKTGSGKTCGFLMPAFHQHLEETKNSQGPRRGGYTKPSLLVLAPTRELSVQIMEECQKFGRAIGIRSVCCYGGSPKYAQISALSRGVEVVIATPGRLNDLLEMRKADLSNIKYLVLDEADRMLDMVRLMIVLYFLCNLIYLICFLTL